jgi:streptogrisin D
MRTGAGMGEHTNADGSDAGAGDAGARDAGAGDAGAGDAGAGDAGAGDAGAGAGADAAVAFDKQPRAGGFGVTLARHDERGANTPW